MYVTLLATGQSKGLHQLLSRPSDSCADDARARTTSHVKRELFLPYGAYKHAGRGISCLVRPLLAVEVFASPSKVCTHGSHPMPSFRFSLLAAVASLSAALLVSPLRVATPPARSRVPQLSADDEFPSDDYSGEAAPVPEAATAAAAPVSAEVSAEIGPLKQQLLALAAGCNRGEAATTSDLAAARTLVERLEMLSPIAEPTLAPEVRGTWDLVFSDTQLFRSSPFFMAGRAVCEDGPQAEQYDWFCDMHRAALAISTIGKVRQVVDGEKLVSEFEVQAGAVPFVSDFVPLAYSGGLPLAITGAIVSTASIG